MTGCMMTWWLGDMNNNKKGKCDHSTNLRRGSDATTSANNILDSHKLVRFPDPKSVGEPY